MRVHKWQGAGNAYLIVDARATPDTIGAAEAAVLCDPRRGIGADGVLVLTVSSVADVRMRIVNPDGSESEACGNGTRMVARFVAGDDAEVTVETVAGVLACRCHATGEVTVAMAPVRLAGPQYRPDATPFPYAHRFISIGNPHVTINVPDPEAFPLASEGPRLEHHPWLPERANVEVWTANGSGGVAMRVWERGVGETAACGSGACAVAVAAVLDGVAVSPVTVALPGGTLRVEVGDDLAVAMTGPAAPIATIDLAAGLLTGGAR